MKKLDINSLPKYAADLILNAAKYAQCRKALHEFDKRPDLARKSFSDYSPEDQAQRARLLYEFRNSEFRLLASARRVKA